MATQTEAAPAANEPASSGPWRQALACTALAFTVRILHASFLAKTPFFDGPIIDAMTYYERAKAIVAGHGWGAPFYQPPLYQGFLAGLLKMGFGTPWGIALVQALFGSITVGLLVLFADAALPRADARARAKLLWLTGVIAALYGPLVLFDLEWLPPVLVNPLIVASWLLCLNRKPTPSWREPLAGLCIGTAATGWGMSLIMLPAMAVLRAALIRKRNAVLVAVGLLLAGVAPPIWKVWKANSDAGAPNVLISWNAGINLWLGNGPNWRHTWRARPGAEFEPELERPDRGGIVKAGERSDYFMHLVWQDVKDRPFAAIGRTLEKLYYAWHGREIRRNQDMEILRGISPVLRVLQWELGLCFPFGLVAPLAFFALWRRRRERIARVLGLTALAYTAALACFFIASRYRLAVALVLIPLAADEIVHRLQVRRWSQREGLVLLGFLAVLNFPNAFTFNMRADEAEKGILLAQAHRQAGRTEEAERLARDLVDLFPDRANVQMLYAEMLLYRSQWQSAIAPLQRTAELAPRASTPWVSIGNALRELRYWPPSEAAYLHALALHPHHAQALKGIAVLYMNGNRPLDAIAYLRRFRAEGYEDSGVEFDLGRLLVDTGKPEEGLDVLEPLLRKQPDDSELRSIVERARAQVNGEAGGPPAHGP